MRIHTQTLTVICKSKRMQVKPLKYWIQCLADFEIEDGSLWASAFVLNKPFRNEADANEMLRTIYQLGEGGLLQIKEELWTEQEHKELVQQRI